MQEDFDRVRLDLRGGVTGGRLGGSVDVFLPDLTEEAAGRIREMVRSLADMEPSNSASNGLRGDFFYCVEVSRTGSKSLNWIPVFSGTSFTSAPDAVTNLHNLLLNQPRKQRPAQVNWMKYFPSPE